MPAAIAIPAIIGAASAGAQVYGAKKGADAAKKAASQQQQSVDQAQAFNKQAWDAQQAALSPYRNAGQFALAQLQARQYGGSPSDYMPPPNYGPKAGGSIADMQNAPRFGTNNVNAGALGPMNGPSGWGAPPTGRNYQPNQPLNLTGMDVGTQPPPTLDDYSAAMRPPIPPGMFPPPDGHALMRSPDGIYNHVPLHMADEARKRGARHHDEEY